jgi:hypothetical protein
VRTPQTFQSSCMGDLVLIPSPYLQNSHGMGVNARAMKPRRLLPQPTPSLSYIGCPTKGRQAPKMERSIVAAAMAEAAYRVNASTR